MKVAEPGPHPPVTDERVGRPRDSRLDHAILDATRELLTTGSYAELSMESVAARAGVGKKTLYRRWSSKAPLVAEAVLEAYGRSGSFPVAHTGIIRADLRAWLSEHAEFSSRANQRRVSASSCRRGGRSPGRRRGSLSTIERPAARGVDDATAPSRRRRRTPRRRGHRCRRARIGRHAALSRAHASRRQRRIRRAR